MRGLCRLARAITAFGLPWHVLTCSGSAKRSLSLLTVDWLQAHSVAATQVLWCTAGPFCPYMITLHHPPPPSRDPRVLAAAVYSFYCLEIGFFLTAPIGCRGRLSVRDSSLFCMVTWDQSFLVMTRRAAIQALEPVHNPEIPASTCSGFWHPAHWFRWNCQSCCKSPLDSPV